MNPPRSIRRPFALLVPFAAAAFLDVASAQSVKLNGPLATELRTGDAAEHVFTPDGTRLVYRADAAQDNVFELFSVLADGSAPPVELHPPLPAGRTVPSCQITPDGTRVVFRADREVAGHVDLYSTRIEGSALVRKLDQTLPYHRGRGRLRDIAPEQPRRIPRQRARIQPVRPLQRPDRRPAAAATPHGTARSASARSCA